MPVLWPHPLLSHCAQNVRWGNIGFLALMLLWLAVRCNTDRFNSAVLRITEDSAKQLMISLLFTEICMIRLLGVMYDYCVSPAHSEKLLLLMKCCISVGRWSRIGTWDWNTTWWTRSRRGIFLWITTGRVSFLRKETGWGKWGRKRFPHFFREIC